MQLLFRGPALINVQVNSVDDLKRSNECRGLDCRKRTWGGNEMWDGERRIRVGKTQTRPLSGAGQNDSQPF
eukprot:166348-Rhodomonas_salina.2